MGGVELPLLLENSFRSGRPPATASCTSRRLGLRPCNDAEQTKPPGIASTSTPRSSSCAVARQLRGDDRPQLDHGVVRAPCVRRARTTTPARPARGPACRRRRPGGARRADPCRARRPPSAALVGHGQLQLDAVGAADQLQHLGQLVVGELRGGSDSWRHMASVTRARRRGKGTRAPLRVVWAPLPAWRGAATLAPSEYFRNRQDDGGRHGPAPRRLPHARGGIISIGDDFWIENGAGERVYKVDGKAAARARDLQASRTPRPRAGAHPGAQAAHPGHDGHRARRRRRSPPSARR